MSLWSIGAAQKKEEVPGSSKWIRNELFTLHDLIANDVEQFAYSVASELTWIDEQMEEVLNDEEKNPKLLLESPTKLRGSNSPIKKLREHALALKSPLKQTDSNKLNISPIKFNSRLDDSPSRKMSTDRNRTIQQVKSPLKIVPLAPPKQELTSTVKRSPSSVKSQSPFLDAAKISNSGRSSTLSSIQSKLAIESGKETSPSFHQDERNNKEVSNKDSESKNASGEQIEEFQRESTTKSEEILQKVGKTEASQSKEDDSSKPIADVKMNNDQGHDHDNEEEDNEYDASMEEEVSFQSIRKSIRRSILKRAQEESEEKSEEKSEENSANAEGILKHSQEEEPQQSSMVVNQGSIDVSKESNEPNEPNESKSSNTTIKVPLKGDNKSESAGSNTPPHHRQSQGFALLPHRDPLTVKSANKKRPTEGPEGFNSKATSNENNGSSPATKLSPLVFKPSLYPTISLQDNEPFHNKQDTTAKSKSPQPEPEFEHDVEIHQEDSPSKKAGNRPELNGKLVETKQLAYSPPQEKITDMAQPQTNSPLSNLFASVGSTLRRARSKFSKDQLNGKDDLEKNNKVHKPKKISNGSPKGNLKSPNKRIVSNDETNIISRLTAPTEASQAKSVNRIASGTSTVVAESPTKNKEDRFSLKFSPVKSIYGSLRSEMNKSVSTSPSKLPQPQAKSPKKQTTTTEYSSKAEENPYRDQVDENRKSQGFKSTSNQPKNLARMSLTKPQRNDNNQSQDTNSTQQRKSFTKSLASMPLDPSSKQNNRFRQKSLVGDHQPLLKRKTQTEEEIKNQPYRKIPAKVVAPSTVQSQQQEAKRRRTADQIQNVLQKRASRVSTTTNDHREQSSNEHLPESKDHQQHQQYHQPLQHPPQQQPASRIIPQTNTKHSKYVPNTQTLMKTAVLQHARMNNETTKTNNTFQTGSMNKASSTSSMVTSPVTPRAPTVLPEIFSESDDDEEGSVLKDWANSPELRNILINQQNVDPDQVFGPIAPLHMEEIFKNSRLSRFRGRGSSAQWSGQDGLTIQEIEKYKQKAYKK